MACELSVVIPTYNNLGVLRKTLEALARQSHPLDGFEVVVVVDGSPDGTAGWLASFAPKAPYPFQWTVQENAGPGPARNNGLRRARHDVCLIINDDFIPDGNLVAAHAAWHAAHPESQAALLGQVREFAPSDGSFNMSRLDKSFSLIEGRGRLEWHHFWTTNVSLKRSFLERTGEWFSNVFPHPVHEDVEMGLRLARKGLALFHEPSAGGLHEHVMTYEQYMRRAYQSGVCLAAFYRLHPDLREHLVARGLVGRGVPGAARRWWAASLVMNPATAAVAKSVSLSVGRAAPALAAFLFDRLFGYHQRRGVGDGLKRAFSPRTAAP